MRDGKWLHQCRPIKPRKKQNFFKASITAIFSSELHIHFWTFFFLSLLSFSSFFSIKMFQLDVATLSKLFSGQIIKIKCLNFCYKAPSRNDVTFLGDKWLVPRRHYIQSWQTVARVKKLQIQSNLFTTTTLETLTWWSLFRDHFIKVQNGTSKCGH